MPPFAVILENALSKYEDEKEFLDAWNNRLDRYNLHENGRLQGIHALRKKIFAADERHFQVL